MKLITVLLFAICMNVNASGIAQSITLSEKNASLEVVFKKITKQSGYIFWYENKLISQAKKVSVNVQDASLNEALKLCLANQPLDYEIVDKTVVIKEKNPLPKLAPAGDEVAAVDVRGLVSDKDGKPLQGVSVLVKGTTKGTNTNDKGEYTIKNVNDNDVLVFTVIGYDKIEAPVNGRTNIGVQMNLSPNSLDETVVIAYGKTSKRFNTGNVATVSGKTIENQVVSDPLAALQGRVAGLNISATNGLPGSRMDVRLRGENSIVNGSDPLYIIDGVPFISTPLNQFTGANGTQSPLTSINPNDIDRIDILKDADATSIYGSRGANGVILITTKKGKAGKAAADFNVYTGVSKVTNKLGMLSTKDYLAMRSDAYKFDSIAPDADAAPDLLVWNKNTDNNWQDLLIGSSAKVTQAQATISGGNATTRFLISGTYYDATTIYPSSPGYKRGSMHFNLDHTSLDGKFNITASINYSADKNNIVATDITQYYNLPPNYPIYDSTGNYYWYGNNQNPFAMLNRTYQSKTNNLIGNSVLRYTIIPGLNVRVNLGYTKTGMTQTQTLPEISFNPDLYSGSLGQYGFSDVTSYIAEPQADYNLQVGKGNLVLLAGASWQQSITDGHSLIGSGYSNDALLMDMKEATELSVQNFTHAEYKYQSVFGRATYNWEQKYILNGTFRRDGSSRYGPNTRFGNFGSIGAAWIFSNENFVKDNLSFLSFGKLRGSYGTTGNDQIGDYKYLDSWTASNFPYGGGNALNPVALANPDYRWETTRKTEVGLELGFLKNNILFNTSYYSNRSGSQVVNYTLSPQSGFESYTANLPAKVENAGWEFEVNTINIRNKNFTWTTSFNISIATNKLLEYPDLDKSVDASRYEIGKSLRIVKGYHFTGVNSQTGLAEFLDVNKDGSISEGDDYVVLGSTLPKYFGGLQNSISYKAWSLDFMFQFVKQEGPTIDYGAQASIFGSMANQTSKVANYWKQPGDITNIPRPSANSSDDEYSLLTENYRYSDAAWGDASFIRLKNVSLKYDLSRFTKAWKIDNASVYFQAQNLWTITNYDGFDPETKGFNRDNISPVLPFGTIRPAVVPTLRSYTLGLKFSL